MDGLLELDKDFNLNIGTFLEELSETNKKDMDLIDTLWRQDIDMGISREESYALKEELLLENGEQDKVKPQQLPWEQYGYNIDGETGEYVQNCNHGVQPQSTPVLPEVQVQPDGNISLEDCLQLLEDEYLPSSISPPPPTSTAEEQFETQHPLSPIEQEQRWQDLSCIPELATQLHNMQAIPYAPANGMMNISQHNTSAYAMNVTTNGNVNLQNATEDTSVRTSLPQNSLHNPHEGFPAFPGGSFSPLSHFANLSLASASQSNVMDIQQQLNFSNFLLPNQSHMPDLPHESTHSSPLSNDNSSTLMELLNTSNVDDVDQMELDFDDHIHNVMQAFGDTNSSESVDDTSSGFDEISDGNSPSYYTGENVEGATGYNASLDGHNFKGGSAGYGYHRQRGGSSCGDSDSGSSFSSYNSQSSTSENIKHNHTYSSSNANANANRSSNISKEYLYISKSERQNLIKLSRDERRSRTLKVPVPIDKIISLPVDAFNDLLKKYDLTDAQLNLIRDIRRRGKNKVAAQNCRKRKISALVNVEVNIETLREERDQLQYEKEEIAKERVEMQSRYEQLYNDIIENMCDEDGHAVDPLEFTLQLMQDGNMFLVPRNGSTSERHFQK